MIEKTIGKKIDNKKNYLAIMISIIVNNFGDVLFDLFIVWNITNSSGDIMNAVYLLGSSILFRAVIALFIGILVDRIDKKKLIILSNISSALIIVCFACSYSYILQHIGLGIFFILLNDINNEVFGRSYLVMASELFSQEVFIKFRAGCTIINRVVVIAGSSIVGFLVALIPDKAIFLIDIVTFMISAGCIGLVRYKHMAPPQEAQRSIGSILKDLRGDLGRMFSEMTTNPFIKKFIVIMFILNLAYGYIPEILPVKIADDLSSAVILGMIKSFMAIGEILGLAVVSRKGSQVSRLFKISMIGNALCMLSLAFTQNSYGILLIFFLYGFLDFITQPLFSYTVTMIDEADRGKIMGGIDTVILLSPSIGMYLFARLMRFHKFAGYIGVAGVFIVAFLIVLFSRELNRIVVKSE